VEQNPFDISEQAQEQEERKDRARLINRADADDLKWLMSNKRGRRFIWRLLERTGLYRSSFTGNSATFFNEGQRNVGLQVLSWLNEHCPAQYITMLTEQRDA
jgi:hypothetical protein